MPAILLVSDLAGLVTATPMQTAVLKFVSVGASLLVGAVIAFWRVKMLAPEQLIMVRMRGLTRVPQGKKGGKGDETPALEKQEEGAFEFGADSGVLRPAFCCREGWRTSLRSSCSTWTTPQELGRRRQRPLSVRLKAGIPSPSCPQTRILAWSVEQNIPDADSARGT